MAKTSEPVKSEANFENAIQRLESIVDQMESDKMPLEDLLVRYEEGLKLVKFCSEKLTDAEKRIDIITRNASGKAVLTEFEPAAGASASETTPGDSKSLKPAEPGDVRLF